MSADNFYLIRQIADGTYAVSMGFMSPLLDAEDQGMSPAVAMDYAAPLRERDPRFPTFEEALGIAVSEYAEYGVLIDESCEVNKK